MIKYSIVPHEVINFAMNMGAIIHQTPPRKRYVVDKMN